MLPLTSLIEDLHTFNNVRQLFSFPLVLQEVLLSRSFIISILLSPKDDQGQSLRFNNNNRETVQKFLFSACSDSRTIRFFHEMFQIALERLHPALTGSKHLCIVENVFFN